MSTTERTGRARTGKGLTPEPRDWEEVNQRLAYLGEVERQIRTLRDQLEQKVAVLKQQWLEASGPMERERECLQQQLERFYWARRGDLIAQGRKSVELAFGRLGSRHSRNVLVEDAAAAQQWLEAHGLGRFVRTRTDVDREAIRSLLLSANGAGDGVARKLLSCPVIQLLETEQFWYQVSRDGLGPGHRTGRQDGTSNLRGGREGKFAPARVTAEPLPAGGCYDRTAQ